MAAAGAQVPEAPLLPGLPDEIVVWEILVRLPPKSLLRCRAVSPAWRRATSTRDFLLAHHHHQPQLPLIYDYERSGDDEPVSLAIIPLDQPQPVARLNPADFRPEASCDGLLVLSMARRMGFCVCNPATRQCAPLPQLAGFSLAGIYPHIPTHEYRLLLYSLESAPHGFYLFALGSGQPPRHIGECPGYAECRRVFHTKPVLLHGSLHWCIGQRMMVFDTTAESFRRMRSPVASSRALLFETGGLLAISSLNDGDDASIDIWVMPDYGSGVWAFRHRVELPVAQLTETFGKFYGRSCVVVPSRDGHVLLVLAKFGDWLLQIDTNGELVASCYRELFNTTRMRLQQTLVPHTFFSALEGYDVNDSPFI